jgi:hypothetical protein
MVLSIRRNGNNASAGRRLAEPVQGLAGGRVDRPVGDKKRTCPRVDEGPRQAREGVGACRTAGELGADEALVLFLGTPECLLGERAGPARLPQRDLH